MRVLLGKDRETMEGTAQARSSFPMAVRVVEAVKSLLPGKVAVRLCAVPRGTPRAIGWLPDAGPARPPAGWRGVFAVCRSRLPVEAVNSGSGKEGYAQAQ